MPLVVKVNRASISPLGECGVSVPPYKGADPRSGDPAFLWTCETADGEGLAMRGIVSGVTGHGGRVDLRIRITDRAPSRALTKEMLRPYRNGGADPVMVSLAGKLYRHAHTKVADLTNDEARFLDGFFVRTDP